MKMIKILWLNFLLLALACNEKGDGANEVFDYPVYDVPELLDRNPAIQYGKEWENVQNTYGEALRSVREKSNALEACLKLAKVFINEARVTGEHGHYYPAALNTLDYVLEQNPEDADSKFRAMSLKASVLLSQHVFDEALKIGRRAVELNPYNAQVYGVLVDANVELGDYEEAVKMADKMVSIRPDLRSYSRIAYLREIHGDMKGALEAMQLAVAATVPGHEAAAWARLTLGDLYLASDERDNAEWQYVRALSEREAYPFALAALANLKMEDGEMEEAEKLLKQACEAIPEVGFYEQLAELYLLDGRKKKAERLIEDVLLMLEDDIESGHNMNLEYAAVYLNLFEKPEKALTFLEKEYKKRPDNIDVNRMLARAYFEAGVYEKTKKYLESAGRTGSKHPDLVELQEKMITRAVDFSLQ